MSQPLPERRIVAYYSEIELTSSGHVLPGSEPSAQKLAVRNFAKGVPVVAEFSEGEDAQRGKSFPVLERAIACAKRERAILVIAELGNNAQRQEFTSLLIDSQIDFLCVDRPSVNRHTLPAVVEHVENMRKMHRELIIRGLEATRARLGNPNAVREINKVNRPKIENAVIFALILAPIIKDYNKRGYSQRKMVAALNDAGFTAPEGGKWVLSQLQKVLDRIRLNELAQILAPVIADYQAKNYSARQIVHVLNVSGYDAPGKGPWDADKLDKLIERIVCVREIIDFNGFILEVYPLMKDFVQQGMTIDQMAEELNKAGLTVPERVAWELAEEEVAPGELMTQEQSWDAERVEALKGLASKRVEAIDMLKDETLSVAEEILHGE